MTSRSCAKIGLGVALFCSLSMATVAPSFSGKLAKGGKKTSLDRILKKDRVVLLSFWATWCVPCLKELTEMAHETQKHPEVPVDVVSVNVDLPDTRSEIKPTIRLLKKQSGFDFPVILDSKQEIFEKYQQAKTLPFSVLIGPDGTILKSFSGYNETMFSEIRSQAARLFPTKATSKESAAGKAAANQSTIKQAPEAE